MKNLNKRKLFTGSLLTSTFLICGTMSFGQELPTFNSNITEPVMELRNDTQFSLKEMPSKIIYEAPSGWNDLSSIPEEFNKFIKFINNMYNNDSFMFWKEEEGSIILAIAPYEKHYTISEVNPNEQDISVINKAGERYYWTDQYFKLTLKDNNIEIVSTLPTEYQYDNFIPWNYFDSFYIKHGKQTSGKMIWSNKLNTFIDGEIAFIDIRQVVKDPINIIKKIDEFSIEASYNENNLTYIISLEDAQISDPLSDDSAVMKIGELKTYIIFNDINEDSFGDFVGQIYNPNIVDYENPIENDILESPFSGMQVSLDINKIRGNLGKYDNDNNLRVVKRDYKINNIALRAKIEDLNTDDSKMSGEFLIYRDPISVNSLFQYLPEISLLPNLIRGSFSSDADSFINGSELFGSIYGLSSGKMILNTILEKVYQDDVIVDFDNLEIGHSGWNMGGEGKTQFISVGEDYGFLTKILLGSNNLNLFSNLPEEVTKEAPELSELSMIANMGLENSELKEKLEKSWAFEVRITDKDPLLINDIDVARKFSLFLIAELMKDEEYLEYKNNK
mgnify:CR=1 FL=1